MNSIDKSDVVGLKDRFLMLAKAVEGISQSTNSVETVNLRSKLINVIVSTIVEDTMQTIVDGKNTDGGIIKETYRKALEDAEHIRELRKKKLENYAYS